METAYYFLGPATNDSSWAKFVPIVLGFVLTTLLGGMFTWRLQALATARQTRLELFRKRYDEGTLALSDVSCLIDTRYFALQRLLWSIEEGNSEKIAEREKQYFDVVVKWNNSLRSNRNKLRLLVGEAEADDFLDYGDDAREGNSKSIHYQFVAAHQAVMNSKDRAELQLPAQETVTQLNYSVSIFLERVTTEFSQRANSLAILELPPATRARVQRGTAVRENRA